MNDTHLLRPLPGLGIGRKQWPSPYSRLLVLPAFPEPALSLPSLRDAQRLVTIPRALSRECNAYACMTILTFGESVTLPSSSSLTRLRSRSRPDPGTDWLRRRNVDLDKTATHHGNDSRPGGHGHSQLSTPWVHNMLSRPPLSSAFAARRHPSSTPR